MAKRAKKQTLVIDIGGSAIKGMILDEEGRPLSARLRLQTPKPATVEAVMRVLGRIAAKKSEEYDQVAVGFPGVLRGGIVATAPNLDESWKGQPLDRLVQEALGRPVRSTNDTNLHGLAAIKGKGTELVLALGTGFGSALFIDGRPVPNFEMAHHPLRKAHTYEDLLGNAALQRHGKKEWNRNLRLAIETLDRLFHYDALLVGGGNARHIKGQLEPPAQVIPNRAALLGGVALWKL